MKNNLPFDDFMKEHLGNYTPDVPDRIWENIIAKRRAKPKGFWMSFSAGKYLLMGIALVIVSGAAYFFIFSSKNADTNSDINNTKQTSIQTPGTHEKSSDKNIENLQSENRPSNTANQYQQNEIKNGKASHQQKNTEEITSNSQSIKIKENKNLNITSSSSSSEEKFHLSSKGDRTREEIVSQQKHSNISSAESNSYILKHSSFPLIFNNTKDGLSNKNVLNKKNYKFPDCPTIEENAAGNKKYWEVYAGPDHAFGSYKTFGDTASSNYLEKRKASTTSSSAFSAGVRYTKVFNNGVSVRAGLNYSQINEKFKYVNLNEIRYVTVITTRVIIRSPGDTLFINDTLQYQLTGTRAKTTYNKYRSIDIPLVIGYELGNGKFHANINAGVIINIYSWYKGDVLDSTYQPVSITTGKKSSIYQFKNNIGVGFLGSVSLYYKITDKLHLLLEPYFRYNLSPMSKDNLNLQQKYHTAGIRAGLRLDIK